MNVEVNIAYLIFISAFFGYLVYKLLPPKSKLRWAFVFVITLILFAYHITLFFAWLFRDGLGPDSVESTGIYAFEGIISLAWEPLLLISFFAVMVIYFILKERKRYRS